MVQESQMLKLQPVAQLGERDYVSNNCYLLNFAHILISTNR